MLHSLMLTFASVRLKNYASQGLFKLTRKNKEPDAICASTKYPELKWVSGFFYWMRDVQAGDFGSWNYQNELTKLAADPENANLRRQFINAVSGIVNRGSPTAGNVDGGPERANNFDKAWAVFGPIALSIEEGGTGIVVLPSEDTNVPVMAGGIAGGVAAAILIVAAVVVLLKRRSKSGGKNVPQAQLSAANPTFVKV